MNSIRHFYKAITILVSLMASWHNLLSGLHNDFGISFLVVCLVMISCGFNLLYVNV